MLQNTARPRKDGTREEKAKQTVYRRELARQATEENRYDQLHMERLYSHDMTSWGWGWGLWSYSFMKTQEKNHKEYTSKVSQNA